MDKKKFQKMNLKDLITPDYNPRKIDKEQMEGLKRSLDTFGYITPIIVNEFNNHVVGGNQRVLALKELGYEEVDAILINEPDINREKQLNIRLNKNSGDWDDDKLTDVLKELKISDYDIEITGFNESDFDLGYEEVEVDEVDIDLSVQDESTDYEVFSSSENVSVDVDEKTLMDDEESFDDPVIEEDESDDKIDYDDESDDEIDYDDESNDTISYDMPSNNDINNFVDDIESEDSYDDLDEDYEEEEVFIKKSTKKLQEPKNLPIAPVKRIIKEAGAERVSDNAAIFLANILEENAKQISEKAVMMANVAGRKTITDEDFEIILNS